MKLVDLEPRWIVGGRFSFLCPVCRKQRLAIMEAWQITGTDFATISVFPSLNANPSHGHFEIIRGEIIMSNECAAECRRGL